MRSDEHRRPAPNEVTARGTRRGKSALVEAADDRPDAIGPDTSRLWDYAATAAYLGLSVGTLRSMVSRRQIPHVRLSKRLVRFAVEDLESVIAARRVEAGTR